MFTYVLMAIAIFVSWATALDITPTELARRISRNVGRLVLDRWEAACDEVGVSAGWGIALYFISLCGSLLTLPAFVLTLTAPLRGSPGLFSPETTYAWWAVLLVAAVVGGKICVEHALRMSVRLIRG